MKAFSADKTPKSPQVDDGASRAKQGASPGTDVMNLAMDAGQGMQSSLSPEQLQTMDVEAILAMPAAEEKRGKPEMESDVESARVVVNRLSKTVESLDALEERFAAIKERFRLKRIEMVGLGTKESGVEIEINPKATATLDPDVANKLHLQGENLGNRQLASKPNKVTFETGVNQETGDTWGLKMVASLLGPNHPKGYGPRGQSKLMAPLPTKPYNKKTGLGHKGKENRYVKGHLLNDSLGGPGEYYNMFPITGEANAKHESLVENDVKKWVNDQGKFVHYEVTVEVGDKNIEKRYIDDPRNYVDAKFHCEAYVLGKDGDRAKGGAGVKQTIESVHKTVVDQPDAEDAKAQGDDATDTSHKSIATQGEVELSETKNKGTKGYDDPHPVLREKVLDFFNITGELTRTPDSIRSGLAERLGKVIGGKVSRKSVVDALKAIAADDWEAEASRLFSGMSANWNRAIKQLNHVDTLDTVSELISDSALIANIFENLDASEKNFLLSLLNQRYERFLLRTMLDNMDKVRTGLQSFQYVKTLDAIELDAITSELNVSEEVLISNGDGDMEGLKAAVDDIRRLFEKEGVQWARDGKQLLDSKRGANVFFKKGFDAYPTSAQATTDYQNGLLEARKLPMMQKAAEFQREQLAMDDYNDGIQAAQLPNGQAPGTLAGDEAFLDYRLGLDGALNGLGEAHRQGAMARTANTMQQIGQDIALQNLLNPPVAHPMGNLGNSSKKKKDLNGDAIDL